MIFVSGGTGLVGAHLLFDLVKSNKEVVALKRAGSNLGITQKIFSYYSEDSEKLFQKIHWVDGDILDYFSLEKALNGVVEVYHCAAIVSFDSRQKYQMISNNVEGTANLVNASLENKVKKFCHVSSIASLGRNSAGIPVTEETKWIPSKKNSGYSDSKFFSEAEVWRGIEEGLDAVIVNPSIILGPGNWQQGSPKLFQTVYDGLKFYTKGTTGFVDVWDVVKAMTLLMEDSNFEKNKNQRFLLNAETLSYQQLFHEISNALNKPAPRYFASDFLLGIAWRLAKLQQSITGKEALISRDSVANSNALFTFDGDKITRSLEGFEYKSISQSIKEIAEIFKKEKAQSF